MCDEMGGETMDMNDGDMSELSNDIPEDIPEDVPEDIPEDIPEEQLVDDTAETSEDIPEEQPVEDTTDVSEDISEEQLVDNTLETKDYTSINDLRDKKCYDGAKSSYDTAEQVSDSSDLKYYKAHDLDGHIRKVIEKSAEAADILEKTEGKELDKNDIAIAALYHDTGMDGGDKYQPEDGESIRKNHSMTSAIHVLENRRSIAEDGGNPDQVAALSLLHSKSCSGVRDLGNEAQIRSAFDKLSDEIHMYNSTHDEKIDFHPEVIDVDRFKYNATALRLGDAFGHDSSESKTQSGGFMDITYETINANQPETWSSEGWKDEIVGSSITYHSPNEDIEVIDDQFENTHGSKGFTRMYQFGEGNISEMGSTTGSDGEYNSYFNVNSNNAPNCTLQCIAERLQEVHTADRLLVNHSTDINLPEDCNVNTVKLYESFAEKNANEFGTIRINVGGRK